MARPVRLLLPLLLAVSGCKGADAISITGPATSRTVDGIEQRLELVENANVPFLDIPGHFFIRSTLVNRGVAAVSLRVTTCEFVYGQSVKSNPELRLIAVAEPSCLPEPHDITLQPGQSSNTIVFAGAAETLGHYTISFRHAVDPEIWGTFELDAR